jgi:long-chain acyl-CoA synthetase
MTATLYSTWQGTVAAAPDAVAWTDAVSGETISRAELDRQAGAWAEAHGAGLAGQTVVLAELNGVAWWRVFLGLLRAGAVVAPLDASEPPAGQEAVARAIGAAWLWREGTLQPVAERRRAARDGRRIIKLTSGSTGTPRALAFTDAQMLADGRQVCAGMEIRPDDVNLGLIPLGHSYGLGNLVLPLLQQGTAIVGGPAALPHALAETIARWRPTVFPAVPAILRALADTEIAPEKLASLRTIVSAGAPLAPEVAQRFEARFGRPVHSFYGSSETGGITYDVSGDAARTGRSVGRPLPGVELVFGRGKRFLVTSAAVVTIGHRRRDARGFGAHRPADLGELTAAGELTLLGRSGRWVKIGGRRLSLAEVERALRAVPGVRDALVEAHPGRADALAAAVATDRSTEEIRAALRDRLAPWKIPKKLVAVAAFPLTARGKTDTRSVRGLLGDAGGG